MGQNAYFVAVGQLIAKPAWNYLLLEGDGGEGVHNPSFFPDIISASIDALTASLGEFEEVEE